MQSKKSDIRLALALFCLLTCLYWLTGSAHTSIADEETMYIVTESLVERGTFAQLVHEPEGSAPRVVAQGRDGHLYAVTGPLQSLLAVPFYLMGAWVAQAFPPPFYEYFTRFFVCFFNAPVCGATAALLYLFGIDLGYRRRTALFVTLTFGLSTIAWPYARTFYAETLLTFWLVLTAWAAYRYTQSKSWGWMALVGIAMGLGMATKYVMIIASPVFVLYLLTGLREQPAGRARWRWIARTALAGGLPFAVIAGILGGYNYVRFGSLLETGYTARQTFTNAWLAQPMPLSSLYGFFFSSGKGFFFFSPPAILSLWGAAALFRRRRYETWLLVAVAAIYPLFYSLTTPRWHGGGNWGPRYIVCITPFLTLPIGAFLERRDLARWLRVGSATLLFVLGFWIQMSTIFVNYSTYLFSDIPADRQRFHPADSTLSAQWRLWPQRVSAWQEYDHDLQASGDQFYLIDGGFYDVEVPEMSPFGRWMGDSGRLRIYAQPDQALTIQIAYSRPRLADAEITDWSGLGLVYDGVRVTSELNLDNENERETQWAETLTIPAQDVYVLPGTLEMTATTWIPGEIGDPRKLSIFVNQVKVSSDGTPLDIITANLPHPLPVGTANSWSWKAMFWFYDPFEATARPFDAWPWYVWTSGAPLPQTRVLIIMLIVVLGGGFITSTAWFVSILRSCSE
ncbi:MAG: phospholipid carrier-dependent glycosyltransferase [Chloroflexi bacterium]|nr:phospholipid carrier-dependent glycosyltransferase [Chloroflexota bacterium]